MSGRRSVGPIIWRRPPTADGTRLTVRVVADDDGARTRLDVGDQERVAELAGRPSDRPAVLLVDEPVEVEGEVVEAVRLPDGTDQAVTDAIQFLNQIE